MRAALSGLTLRGRIFTLLGGGATALGMLTGQLDLLRVGVLLLALVVLSVAVVVRSRYRVASQRHVSPTRTAAGTTAEVTLRLSNESRLPTGLLLLEDRVPYVVGSRPRFVLDRVEPRGQRQVVYPVRSDVRGKFQLGPLTLRLTDPFGMCELTRAFTARDVLVVTPVVHPLPATTLGGEWSGSGESRSRSIAAAGEDDVATREYRHGDELRRVHWRSTARRGQLMVRREEQPWQSRATVLLDSRASAHAGDGPASSFEWAVSAAASVALHLLHRGYAVRLLTDTSAASVASGAHEPDGSGADVEGMVLDALAVVTPSALRDLSPVSAALRHGGSDGLLVAVLGALDVEQAEHLARLRSASTTGVAILLRTTTWTPGPPEVLAARARVFDATAETLRASGWRVVPAGPGDHLEVLWPLAGRRSTAAPVMTVPSAATRSVTP